MVQGFQRISEILPVEGMKVIGRLPKDFRRPFVPCMGIGAKSRKGDETRSLMRFLVSDAAASLIGETGLDPLFLEVGRGDARKQSV